MITNSYVIFHYYFKLRDICLLTFCTRACILCLTRLLPAGMLLMLSNISELPETNIFASGFVKTFLILFTSLVIHLSYSSFHSTWKLSESSFRQSFLFRYFLIFILFRNPFIITRFMFTLFRKNVRESEEGHRFHDFLFIFTSEHLISLSFSPSLNCSDSHIGISAEKFAVHMLITKDIMIHNIY